MAEGEPQLDRETCSCSVCLDLLKDPVTIPCGHSYCKKCIQSFWDEEDKKVTHTCPQCRQTFTPRPIQQRIRDRERDAKLLQLELKAVDVSADKAVRDCERIFTELIRFIQQRGSDAKKQIRSRQKSEVGRVKELQEKLEQEVAELKKRDAEPEQLPDAEDHSQFLQDDSSLSQLRESKSRGTKLGAPQYFEDVKEAFSEARHKMQEVLIEKWPKILQTVTNIDALTSNPQPRSRAELLRYSREITLDPNTANAWLLLSEGDRRATLMREEQPYPGHPDRFIRWRQVLSRESLTGRCYWEVEWKKNRVNVAVAYGSVGREGSLTECAFGFNDKSWALGCNSSSSYRFIHNGVKTHVSGPWSSRVGVYLDHGAGVLSFYSVSGTVTLLHRVQTSFAQPLHAGVWFGGYSGATTRFCGLKETRDVREART